MKWWPLAKMLFKAALGGVCLLIGRVLTSGSNYGSATA